MPDAMYVLLLSILAACTSTPKAPAEPLPQGWYDPGIASTGATPALQLHLLEARLELPASSVPPDHDPGKRFQIALTPQRKKKKTSYAGELPFDVGDDGRRFAPPGMVVYLDGKPIPYTVGDRSWEIKDSEIVVTSSSPVTAVEVAWEGVQSSVDRHQSSRSGLPPEEFVQYEMTLADHTRDGLLLPAPAKAEWDVTVPAESPRFEGWLAIEPSAVATDRSDGAITILSVVENGKATEVARMKLRGPSSEYVKWEVDLSDWKGKQVTVQLSTDPNGTPWFDYVFLGSPTIYGAPAGEVRHVVVIGMDTTRPDHMSFFGYPRKTTPEFDVILGQSAVFDRAYTPAPRTRPSFQTATTGRYPLDAIGATTIGEVFQSRGFATGAFVANVHLQPRFGFHEGFDSWRYDGKSDAADQVTLALEWLEENKDRDTFLFLHIMDPHIFYNAPGSFSSKFVEDPDPSLPDGFNRWEVYQMEKSGELTEQRKKHIEALYDGEMAYTSVHLARFFDGLDALGGRNFTVIHSDHGEEFWEHGGYEHNHNLYRETTNALLAVRPDRGMAAPLRIDTPVTLADIAPTLYDFAAFQDVPKLDGKSLRPLLEGKTGEGWDRPIGIAHLRYGHEQWAVVFDHHKYILHTGTGAEELYDLQADPLEKTDVAAQKDLEPWRAKLAEAHMMPVGAGWRLQVEAQPNSEPFVFTFPEAPESAGVVDPERTVESPNNQAWGEPPSRVPAEIGETELVGNVFTWSPGFDPDDGLLYVMWRKQVDPAGLVVTRGDETLAFTQQPNGMYGWRTGRERVIVQPGTVLIPPPDEAERTRMLEGGGDDASTSQKAWLEAMGYIGGGEGGGEDDHDDHGDRPPED